MFCPYCFSTIQADIMVCENAACSLFEQNIPPHASRLLARLPDRVRIAGGSAFANHTVRCDACGQPTTVYCPECKHIIPETWVNYPQKTYLFLGTKGVGKSTLFATTKLNFSQQQSLMMSPMDVETTAERFYRQYTKPLVEEKNHVPQTPNEMPQPFLWGVTNRLSRHSQTMAMAVYDVPSELICSHAAAAPVRQLLTRADGVVLVVNPVALPALYQRCGEPQGIKPSPDVWELSERVLDELLLHYAIGSKADTSLAVVLTHMDIWFAALPSFASTSALSQTALRQLVRRWGGGSFLNRLQEFRHHRIFATGLYRGDELRALDGAEKPLSFLMQTSGMSIRV